MNYPEQTWTLHSINNFKLDCSGPIPRVGELLLVQNQVFEVTQLEYNLHPQRWRAGPDTHHAHHVNVTAEPHDLTKGTE